MSEILGWKKLVIFLAVNVGLNTTDIVTDGLSFGRLLAEHPLWASLTLFWMFCPFLVHVLIYLKMKMTDCWNKEESKASILGVLVHFPLALPLRNLYIWVQLLRLDYGRPQFNQQNSAGVEKHLAKVGVDALYEGFFEAGPQSVTQLVIIASTGQASTSQIVSVCISLLSLSWGAARAYFLQRSDNLSDPDPPLPLVLLRIFPLKLCVVLQSTILWVSIGGMSGAWTFVAIPINFLTVFAVLYSFCQSPKDENSLMLVKAAVTSVWSQVVTSLKSS